MDILRRSKNSCDRSKEFTLIITGLLLLTVLVQSTVSGEPVFRAGPDRSGVILEEFPNNSAPLWTFTTGDQVQSSPVYYNGIVYFGSDDGKVYAVDALMGEEIWNFSTGNLVLSTPAIHDGTLYIGSSDGYLYVLDAATGSEKWNFRIEGEFGEIKSSPVIEHNLVFFGATDFNIYAVNLTSHDAEWTFETGGEIWASPSVSWPYLYVGALDATLYCLWAANGTQAWNYTSTSWEGIYTSSPVWNDMVFFGEGMDGEGLHALNATTGELIWVLGDIGPMYGSPAVHRGVVYIPAWGPPSMLYAVPVVDPSPGDHMITKDEVYWSFQIDDEQGGSSPTVSDEWVVVGSDYGMGGEGRIFCIDIGTGKERWNATTGGDVYSTPTVNNGVVYVGSNDKRVYALGGSGEARMTVEAVPSTDRIQGGRVVSLNFLVTYRGVPLEGAFVKVSASIGELSQEGASTFPDGTQMIKWTAPDVDRETITTFDVSATFFGLEDAKTSTNVTIVPASHYRPPDSGAQIKWSQYYWYIGFIAVLGAINIVVFIIGKRKRRKVKEEKKAVDAVTAKGAVVESEKAISGVEIGVDLGGARK
jgi:outer membrane protein assembly factor BamB